MQATQKSLDIVRGRQKNIQNRERKTKTEKQQKKSQTTPINIFLILLFYIEKFIFC